MRLAASIVLIIATWMPHLAVAADSDRITRALAFAKSSKDGAGITETLYKHCRERALTFTDPPRAAGKSENNLNEIGISRHKLGTVVTFAHYGSAYDGVNCKITVRLNGKDVPFEATTRRLR